MSQPSNADSPAGPAALSEQDCYELLQTARIGRVLVSMNALPAALPVNFRVTGEKIVFRTAPGTKLAAAVEHTVLGFEVDHIDEQRRCGWSVLILGPSRVVHEQDEIAELDRLGLDSWWMAPAARYVLIDIERMSGRRIGDTSALSSATP